MIYARRGLVEGTVGMLTDERNVARSRVSCAKSPAEQKGSRGLCDRRSTCTNNRAEDAPQRAALEDCVNRPRVIA